MGMFEAQGIHKSYGGVRALRGVDFTVEPGMVHALLGENGAGKSTLVKVMTGATRPDQGSGSLRLDGQDVQFTTTAEAVRHGVAVVSQELNLFPHMTVVANMFPMRELRRGPLIDVRAMRAAATPILDELGFTASTDDFVADLPLADRQLVEIAKALVSKPRVLLLDEPTSALDSGATERLLSVLRVLRSRDVAVVFVSHILQEVMRVCDLVTVLRDGAVALAGDPLTGHSVDSLVNAMVGDRVRLVASSARPRTPAVNAANPHAALRIERLGVTGRLSDVSVVVRPGEIVGLAGLPESGPGDILRVLAGIERPTTGRVVLPGDRPAPRGQRAAISAGVAYVSGDRRRLGLMLQNPLWENIVQVRSMALARDGHFLRQARLRSRADDHIQRLAIKTPSALVSAGSLSGGNQQKVVLAKWLDANPNVMLLDDPTRGVDVGARAEIHELLRTAAAGGACVILRSTDLDEMVAACDRVLVFYGGQVCGEVSGPDLTPSVLLRLMNTEASPSDPAVA